MFYLYWRFFYTAIDFGNPRNFFGVYRDWVNYPAIDVSRDCGVSLTVVPVNPVYIRWRTVHTGNLNFNASAPRTLPVRVYGVVFMNKVFDRQKNDMVRWFSMFDLPSIYMPMDLPNAALLFVNCSVVIFVSLLISIWQSVNPWKKHGIHLETCDPMFFFEYYFPVQQRYKLYVCNNLSPRLTIP